MRSGGGGGANGGRTIQKSPSGTQHFLTIYLSKVTPQSQLKLEQEEIAALCFDKLRIPRDWITGISQSLSDPTLLKVRGKFDLKEFEIEEVVVRPGEVLGSTMSQRETASWVYFYGADLATSPKELLDPLDAFGKVTTPVQEVLGAGRSGRMMNVWTGDRRVGMVVKRAIPQHIFVPKPGSLYEFQMIKVVYSSQKYKCGWCGKAKACRHGKNGKKCREAGTKKLNREEIWERHKRAAIFDEYLEDSDTEGEEEEDERKEESDGEHSKSEREGRGDSDTEPEEEGEKEKEAGEEVAEEVEEVVVAPPVEPEEPATPVEKAESPPKETRQEVAERKQSEYHKHRAALSDMVELSAVPVGKSEREVRDWLMNLIGGTELSPVVLKNPNPHKRRCFVVKNLSQEQRLRVFSQMRRIDGVKVKAAAYMQEDAINDFPEDFTLLDAGASIVTKSPNQSGIEGNGSSLPGDQNSPPAPGPLVRQSTLSGPVAPEGPLLEEEAEPRGEKRDREESRCETTGGGDTTASSAGVNLEEEEARLEEEIAADEVSGEPGGDDDLDFMDGDGNEELREVEAEIGKEHSSLAQKQKPSGVKTPHAAPAFAKSALTGRSPVRSRSPTKKKSKSAKFES